MTFSFPNISVRFTLAAFFFLVIGGCTYQGGDVSPLERKFSWYSYLNGDDLRKNCGAVKGDSLRLVYNAIHLEQIRTYDISIPDTQDQGIQMHARILGMANLSEISFKDLISPWRGQQATTHLRPEDIERLWSAIRVSGAFDPAPTGLRLTSEKFFWLTAICRNGAFFYNAYVWPSERFDRIQFDDLIFAWDMTDVPVNPPRKATPLEIYGEANPKQKTDSYYQITIGENGLVGYTQSSGE